MHSKQQLYAFRFPWAFLVRGKDRELQSDGFYGHLNPKWVKLLLMHKANDTNWGELDLISEKHDLLEHQSRSRHKHKSAIVKPHSVQSQAAPNLGSLYFAEDRGSHTGQSSS
jgi:hypothetical protein